MFVGCVETDFNPNTQALLPELRSGHCAAALVGNQYLTAMESDGRLCGRASASGGNNRTHAEGDGRVDGDGDGDGDVDGDGATAMIHASSGNGDGGGTIVRLGGVVLRLW